MSPRILILTTEPLPLPGLPATGAGMRAWGLGFGLRSAGLTDVMIAFAADAARGLDIDIGLVPGIAMFERGQLDDFIAAQKPAAIVFQHWGLFREMKRDPGCPVAMDLAGPHLLERRLWNSPDPQADLREKLHALSRVDFTVCSGDFQRHYFLPFLIQAGHDPRELLCPVIPFSLSPDLPSPAADRDFASFVFSGMFLPWQDPEATLRTVVKVLEERQRGKLLFIGGPHPSGDVSGGRFDRLQEFLEGSSLVEVLPVMPFDKLLGRLRACGTAIDLMPRNAERELAFPTRTVNYLWAGLPVIHNDYDELAEPIRRDKAGWTLDAADTQGLERLINRLLGHREDVEKRGENAQNLVRAHYTWDHTIGPLADWCRDPKRREGKRAVTVAAPSHADATDHPRRAKRGHISYAQPTPATDIARGPWYLSPIVFLLALPISVTLVMLFGLAELVRILVRPKR
ncbi:hypothetical protein BH09SUM1_BH09SUM1_09380 [soil metagenome]